MDQIFEGVAQWIDVKGNDKNFLMDEKIRRTYIGPIAIKIDTVNADVLIAKRILITVRKLDRFRI